MVTIFGIASGVVRAHDVSLQCIPPYMQIGTGEQDLTPRPAITVYSSGILTDFEALVGQYPNASLKLYACAVPTGVVGPTGVINLISGYIGVTPTMVQVSDSAYPSGSICTITKASIPSPTGVNMVSISGNMHYDLYSTHVITAKIYNKTQIVGYGDLVSLSGVITRSPFPDIIRTDDIGKVNVDDSGETTTTGDLHLTKFSFTFGKNLYLFGNSGSFGGGYPGYAANGSIQMTCSGNASGMFFPGVYDGTNDNVAPIYQYCNCGGTISWLVPKMNKDAFSDYTFGINYINSSGNVTGPLSIYYDSVSLFNMNSSTFVKSGDGTAPKDDDISEPDYIMVDEENGRSRMAVGVNDIDLVVVQYNEKGTYVSAPFTSEKPIYAISMETNESALGFAGYKTNDMVKYYIQFSLTDNGEWYPISPKPRLNEIDSNNKWIPNIYILDTNLFEEDKVIDLYNQVSFVNLNKELYNFRIKIEMDTISTGARGQFTPQVFDYRVSVIDRAALASSNFERYLFN